MRIDWTEPAVEDLGAIRDYIGRDSEVYAGQFVARILRAVDRLEEFPQLGRRVPEAPDHPEVRELLFQAYRIFYRLETEKVVILAVIHGSRDLGRLRPQPWQIA